MWMSIPPTRRHHLPIGALRRETFSPRLTFRSRATKSWWRMALMQRGAGRYLGTMTNRVVVDKPLLVSSLSGPVNAIIVGSQVPGSTNGDAAIRCVYLASGAVLSGFTVANGGTRSAGDSTTQECGGGVWSADASVVVTNCVSGRQTPRLLKAAEHIRARSSTARLWAIRLPCSGAGRRLACSTVAH